MTRPSSLPDALTVLRTQVASTGFPLELPTAATARRRAAGMVEQLDDYLLPRLARLDAPLLVVVGGSTGAGKSTLVNSLVGEVVTPTGILRPTTRAPVLVCHPRDAPWFTQARLLPNLPRVADHSTKPDALRIVGTAALEPGLAVLDAPDIDSVVETNRTLAEQLLAAADLWLFVTSAARYADAVPWDFLNTARVRGTAVALVLDRVPPGGGVTVAGHLGEMLVRHGLRDALLFTVEEQSTVDGQLLPAGAVDPVARWLRELAQDAAARSEVIRRTVGGAVAALDPAVADLTDAADEQVTAVRALESTVDKSYREARDRIEHAISDGSLLRGEVLARWQQLVGAGEFMRGLQSRLGRVRDRVVATVTGRPTSRDEVREALESGLVTLIHGAAADATERAGTAWLAHPAGARLLHEHPELSQAEPDLDERCRRLVRDWQRDVLELVRTEVGDKAFLARVGAYTVNALGLALMIAVFSATAFIPTGAEIAVAGGTTLAAQKVLEAVFGDQAVRTLAQRARELLLARVETLLADDADRLRGPLRALHVDPQAPQRLRDAAAAVRTAREETSTRTAGRLERSRGH